MVTSLLVVCVSYSHRRCVHLPQSYLLEWVGDTFVIEKDVGFNFGLVGKHNAKSARLCSKILKDDINSKKSIDMSFQG